jgi:hypothetical protein
MNMQKTFIFGKKWKLSKIIDIICFSFYLLFTYTFIFPRPQETSETRQAQEFQADQAGVFIEKSGVHFPSFFRGFFMSVLMSSEEWRREGDEEDDYDEGDEEGEVGGEEAIVEIGGASLARRYNGEVMRLSCSARWESWGSAVLTGESHEVHLFC